MGELALYKGERIKIGTCEDMYYLRFDQRHQVIALPGNVDPVKDAGELRFRFPWPDEDHIEPGGGFHDNGFGRAIRVEGLSPSPDVEHYSVQFSAQNGYLVSLPCPESGKVIPGVRIHRNGYGGAVHLSSQRFRPGIGLVPVLRCGGCGTMWREEDRSRIEELAVIFRAEGDRVAKDGRAPFFHAIADRLLRVSVV